MLELCILFEKSIMKYDIVTPITKSVWEIAFSLRDAANQALNNPYLKQHGFIVWLPWMRVFSKGYY